LPDANPANAIIGMRSSSILRFAAVALLAFAAMPAFAQSPPATQDPREMDEATRTV
jgi:hypothetical protein